MKTINDFKGRLFDYSPKEQQEILNIFVNELILDLNAKLTENEINHIQFRVHQKIGTGINIKKLIELRNEIINNHKKYIPLCYASITTAQNNLK